MLRSMVLMIGVLCLAGCLKSPGVRDATFDTLDDGTYIFEDYRLRVEFAPQPKSFRWRFTNHTSETLTIQHDESFLSQTGTAKQYTLWGADRNDHRDIPPIVIKPGGFVAVQYPVLFSSPFMPWRIRSEEPICLFLSGHWGTSRHRTYRLCFLAEKESVE